MNTGNMVARRLSWASLGVALLSCTAASRGMLQPVIADADAASCSRLCGFGIDLPAHAEGDRGGLLNLCQSVCAAVRAQSDTPCGAALLTSSFEHLMLLSYTSGHVAEALGIVVGASIANSTEATAFVSKLHLNDWGSSEGCSDIEDAHYCLGQVPMLASVGLCLPASCDSSSLAALIPSIESNLALTGEIAVGNGDEVGDETVLSSMSFSCGNDMRIPVDAGAITIFCVMAALVALILAGTAVDYDFRWGRGGRKPALWKQQAVSRVRPNVDSPSEPTAATLRDAGIYPLPTEEVKYISGQHTAGDGVQDSGGTLRQPLLASSASRTGSSDPFLPYSEGRGSVEQRIEGDESERRIDEERGTERLRRYGSEALRCFSLITNMNALLAPPRADDGFVALNGIRTFSILWVILGHALVYDLAEVGFTNLIDVVPQDGNGVLARFSAQVIPGAFLAVDTFFLMSGFLLSSILLPKLEAGSAGLWRRMAQAYLHRYLRLTPTIAFVTFFTWKILPLAGEGPGWWPVAHATADGCRRYWWTELTYIANVFPWPPLLDGCLRVTWYLANDVMFFVAGVPLVALYKYNRRAGVTVALLICALSSLFVLLWYGFHKDVRFSIIVAPNPLYSEQYTVPWSRCPVYVIGLLCGFLWHTEVRGRRDSARQAPPDLNEGQSDEDPEAIVMTIQAPPAVTIEQRITTRMTLAIAVSGGALLALPVYGSYWAYQDTERGTMPAWLDHLYLAFSRPAWALGVASICFLCFMHRGGVVNWFLTRPTWATTSRLSYCAYLVHPALLTWLFGVKSSPTKFTALEYSVTFMGCVVGSFAAATAVHLLVEAPFRNLESWCRKKIG